MKKIFKVLSVWCLGLYIGEMHASSEIVCSTPKKDVMDLLSKVINARESDYLNFEPSLDKLHENKSEEATEAIVRLMSLYLGSWPGTANDCEAFDRGEIAIKYLVNPEYCLDEKTAPKNLLYDHSQKKIFENKQYIVDKIKGPDVGWCDFDG